MARRLFDDIDHSSTRAVITEIRPLTSDPNLRQVRIGKKTIATLRASDLETLKLNVGMAWSAELGARVEQTLAMNKARKAAMTLLGKRALAKAELVDRLTAKGHSYEIARAIAAELEADSWIDERAYARAVVHNLTRSKPASIKLIQEKLRARKIDSEVAQEVAREQANESTGVEPALRLARQRLAGLAELPAPTLARRLSGLLARRGFDEDVIAAVLDRLKLSAQHDVRDD